MIARAAPTKADAPAELRVAEVLQAFAHAGNLGSGQPIGHVLRTCTLAMRVADAMALPQAQRQSVYDTALLLHGGCTAGSAQFAAVVACDELRAMRDMCLCDPDSITDVLGWVKNSVAAGAPFPQRVQRMLRFLAEGEPVMGDIERGCADVGARVATRLDLSNDTARSLSCVCERYNGKGPRKMRGAQVPLPPRIVHASMITEIFFTERGKEGALEALRARRGRSLDPDVVTALLDASSSPGLWDDLADDGLEERVRALEPGGPRFLPAGSLDALALAFADFVDLKNPRAGAHARATAKLAEEIAMQLGLPADEVALARRAALVHDLGMVGVPSFVLQKAEPTALEREQIGMHVHYAAQVLARVPALARVAEVAAQHHERLDGSGRPRGLAGDLIARAARVVAVADVYDEALRAGASPEAALAATRAERGLDGVCVAALAHVVTAGRATPPRAENVAGLTDREVEVLRLVAAGCTVKEAAKQLFLSAHTVRHHLEHVYEKVGVTSRAGAVLFAIENGLVK